MAHPDVRSGQVHTAWLERTWSGTAPEDDEVQSTAIAAALLADNRHVAAAPVTDHTAVSAWRLAARRAALK
jgi:hypothetical protein